MKENQSIGNLSFEEAISELEAIVRKIDTGTENLADAVGSFERGVALKGHCDKILKAAELKIEKITKSENGDMSFEKIDIES